MQQKSATNCLKEFFYFTKSVKLHCDKTILLKVIASYQNIFDYAKCLKVYFILIIMLMML